MLAAVDIEMVEPEPGHLLAQLRGRINRSEQVAGGGFACECFGGLFKRLARGLFALGVAGALGIAPLPIEVAHQIDSGAARNIHRIDARLDFGRQGIGRMRVELLLKKGRHALRLEYLPGRGIGAPGDAIEPERGIGVGESARGSHRASHEDALQHEFAHGGLDEGSPSATLKPPLAATWAGPFAPPI